MEKRRTYPPTHSFAVRWERQLGASQLNYSLRWKSLLCCFNDHLVGEEEKNHHHHPPQPTIDTPNEKLGGLLAYTGENHYVDFAVAHQHTRMLVRSVAREQCINHSVKANKLCQSNLTGKLCVSDKCEKATRQFRPVQTSVRVNLSTMVNSALSFFLLSVWSQNWNGTDYHGVWYKVV